MALTIKTLSAARRRDQIKFNRVFNKARRQYLDSGARVPHRDYDPKTGRVTKEASNRTKHKSKRFRKLMRAAGASAHSVRHLGT